jgi:lysozyme
MGSNVFACADGMVTETRLDGNTNITKFPYGNQVRIVHKTTEGEFTTVYAHLQEVHVTAGQDVKAGDILGLADSTGNSDGSHLHLTLKKKGASAAHETAYPNDIVDPTPFLDPFEEGEKPVVQVDDLKFLADVTIPDNSPKNPGEQFVKTWRVLNAGTTTWGEGYTLSYFKDDPMGAPETVPLTPAKPGEAVEVSIMLTAPSAAGLHRSTWKAKSPTGEQFGHPMFALIKVPQATDIQPIPVILDLSVYERITDWQAAQNEGIAALIHKATQGVKYVDKHYIERRDQARPLGFLWGAYHFGVGGDPIGQAQHFLDVVQPDAETLLAVDVERNPYGLSINITEAEQMVQYIYDQVGRWPVVYTARWYMREIIPDSQPTILSNCPLWVASYAEVPALPAQWTTWTLWQYTDGDNGPEPHKVSGITKCDRNKFGGTLDQLREFWCGH